MCDQEPSNLRGGVMGGGMGGMATMGISAEASTRARQRDAHSLVGTLTKRQRYHQEELAKVERAIEMINKNPQLLESFEFQELVKDLR